MVPGYTHDDVDAMFGNISQALDSNSATILPAFENVIKHTFTKEIFCQNNYVINLVPRRISFLAPLVKDIAFHSDSCVLITGF